MTAASPLRTLTGVIDVRGNKADTPAARATDRVHPRRWTNRRPRIENGDGHTEEREPSGRIQARKTQFGEYARPDLRPPFTNERLTSTNDVNQPERATAHGGVPSVCGPDRVWNRRSKPVSGQRSHRRPVLYSVGSLVARGDRSRAEDESGIAAARISQRKRLGGAPPDAERAPPAA